MLNQQLSRKKDSLDVPVDEARNSDGDDSSSDEDASSKEEKEPTPHIRNTLKGQVSRNRNKSSLYQDITFSDEGFISREILKRRGSYQALNMTGSIAMIEESSSDDELSRDEGGDKEGDDEIGDFESYRGVAEDFNQEHGFISIIQSVSATDSDTQIQSNKHESTMVPRNTISAEISRGLKSTSDSPVVRVRLCHVGLYCK